MGTTVPGITVIGPDWRVVDGVATAWFDAPSLIEGAALAGRIVELSAEIVVGKKSMAPHSQCSDFSLSQRGLSRITSALTPKCATTRSRIAATPTGTTSV
jgi:hypothetical protein